MIPGRVVICLEQGANDLHMVQLIPLPPGHLLLQQNPERFVLLVPNQVVLEKMLLHGCMCIHVLVPNIQILLTSNVDVCTFRLRDVYVFN